MRLCIVIVVYKIYQVYRANLLQSKRNSPIANSPGLGAAILSHVIFKTNADFPDQEGLVFF